MSYDAIKEIEDTINNSIGFGIAYDFSNTADADRFSQLYNHDNNYNGLKIGQTITFSGVFMARKEYIIVGFDLEANNLATDGSSANNGYGVYLITPTWATQCSWSNSATTPEPYINSNIRNGSSVNTPYDDNYRDLIGDHLVERNVLVSSSVDPTSGKPTSYSWSKESITVPTMHNMTGESYADDGELNFLLPLCKTAEGIGRLTRNSNYYYWSRNIYGIDTDSYFKAWQYGPRYNSGDCSILSYKRVARPNGIDSDGTQSVAVLEMIMIR